MRKKVTVVREHPLHVPVSKKNPTGITIRDRHVRRLPGTYLDEAEIIKIYRNYDKAGISFPSKGRLKEFKDADEYDDIIAVWTDYFNKKYSSLNPIDPDVVKALIASESGFREDPAENRSAFGVMQITKQTLHLSQDPNGEAKDFIFKDIRQKDLKNSNVSIPLGVRWLHRKRETARAKLGREPSNEEIILEYKGMLKSKTQLKDNALKNFRLHYGKLKNS